MRKIYAIIWLTEQLAIHTQPEKAFKQLEFAQQYIASFYDRIIEWQTEDRVSSPLDESNDPWPRPIIVEMELV